jgi:type II secretory pathway component PulM
MSVLTQVRESVGRSLSRPVAYFSAEWERMAPRERRWVAALAVAVMLVLAMLGSYVVFSNISDLEAGNANIREALAAIGMHRNEYLDAKARGAAQEARIGYDPPQLTADLEAAAREEQVQIDESNERPTTPAGRRYAQHDVDLKIRQVDLQSLSKFLRRVETGPRLIMFTHLSMKRRYSEADKLDVELTATAFERLKEDKLKKKSEKPGDKQGETASGKEK